MYVKGRPNKPFSEQEFIDKFRLCVPYSAMPLTSDIEQSLIKHVLELEHSTNVAEDLLTPLTPRQPADVGHVSAAVNHGGSRVDAHRSDKGNR